MDYRSPATIESNSVLDNVTTVYFIPRVKQDDDELNSLAHSPINTTSYLSFGLFHPSLGSIPPEATLTRQISSSHLHTLLQQHAKAMGSLADPTPPNLKGTIDLDVIDTYKILESWIDLYSPHLLYQLYYPAAAAINWNELTGSEDEPDIIMLEKWLSERKREMDTMDEDAIAKLDEIA